MRSNTAENLKSHLQKFRIHRDRSRGEYASYYELSTRQVEEKFGKNSVRCVFVIGCFYDADRGHPLNIIRI